ncbi:glycoside hydrolase family 130 protein [Chitinophaga sp. B61]|uniref:Glycoside hydrolase family 130 protein n=2 Tax=Chitinophaga rhizophila TaxID=2866212 RepID=A0ABS7GAV0_9BACT|nr:glycoside hydrolase family 130 protein [Chitinophaga rhizophila]
MGQKPIHTNTNTSTDRAANEPAGSLPGWALGPFIRPAGANPVISPDETTRFYDPLRKTMVDWESNDTFNPAAAVKDNKVYVLYRAEDKSGIGIGHRTSRIGLAESSNGLKMGRSGKPVLFPANDDQQEFEWTGGCEDPRVARTEDGVYLMLYTQWNKKTPRLGAATSTDLVHWKKHGPIFQDAYNGKFHDIASKSASILTTLKNGQLQIVKHEGKYWLYWGEYHVYAATSDNLVDWTPVVDEKGALKKLASPRKGYFDSNLTECGPPALLTDKGILLLYNGKNGAGADRDTNYTANSYCAGQMLFSATDPARLLSRLDRPFMVPTEAFEKSGQYPAGTVFIEGLVYFKNRYLLYYGCADSRVAVAIYDPAQKN